MALPINIDDLMSGNTIEWDRIELKEGWNPEEVLHTACAFANDINNWGGGYIIIGLKATDGTPELPPIGLPKNSLDRIQKELVELSHKCAPNYSPITQPYCKDGSWIFVIWCPAGDNRPYKVPVSLGKKRVEKITEFEDYSQEAPEIEENAVYTVGSFVVHSKFGRGRITAISGSGDDTTLTIQFGTRKKKILPKYAKLAQA